MVPDRLMTGEDTSGYDLTRFKVAQHQPVGGQATALAEIRSGGKRSHWIWYVLPQHRELGQSDIALYYGISCLGEAVAYLGDEELEANLIEVCEAILDSPTDDPVTVMGGHTDAMKLRSSMTLFELAAVSLGTPGSVFSKVLDRMFGGQRDGLTLAIVGDERVEF